MKLTLDVAQHLDLPHRHCPAAVAREEDKVDLGLKPLALERPDQIGGEDEASLEHRDDDEVVEAKRGDLGCELIDFCLAIVSAL